MSCGVIGQLGSFMRACNNSVTTECTLLVLFDDMNQHKVEVFSEGNKNLTIYPSQFWHYLVTSKLRWIICQTSEYMNLTAQWGAPQLEGTRSNPRFLITRMSGFTNDLTNFGGFPALGAIIPNYLGWELVDIQN